MLIKTNLNSKLWNTIGVMSNSFAQWFIISILSYSTNIKIVGEYSYFLAVITPIHLLFNLQMRNFLNSTHEKINLDELFSLRIHSSLLFLVISIVIGFFIFKGEALYLFVCLAIAKIFDSFSEFTYSINQKREMIKKIGLSLSIKSLMLIGLSIIFIKIGYGLIGIIISILISSILFAVIDLSQIEKRKIKKYNSLLLFSIIPLAISALITAFNINIPRYALKEILGSEQVGVYTTIFFFYAFTMIIANSVIQIMINKLSNAALNKNKYINEGINYLKISLILSFFFILGNSLFGESIYTLAYGKQLIPHSDLLIHLNYLIPLGLITTKTNYFLMAQNSYKHLLLSGVITIFAHFIIAMTLITQFKIEGAFYALAYSLIINAILNLVMILKRMGVPIWKSTPI